MTVTSTDIKADVVSAATERYVTEYEPRLESLSGGCLLWAAAAQWALKQHMPHVKSIITAGTMMFRFRTEANDDGVSATHFSYVFEQMPAVAKMEEGLLPEMHVWLVLHPETRDVKVMELVDLSTGYQPAQLAKMLGLEWDRELWPPPYLWCVANQIPEQFRYKSEALARAFAVHYLDEFHLRYGLERTWK